MPQTAAVAQHPSTFAPATFVFLIVLGLFGRSDLILPMLVGAALPMLLDGYMLYRMFDTRVFPAAGTWPSVSRRPRRSVPAMPAADAPPCSASAFSSGSPAAGSRSRRPLSAPLTGNLWALTIFGIGLLIRGYAIPVAGIEAGR